MVDSTPLEWVLSNCPNSAENKMENFTELSFIVRGQCRLDYKHCYMSHRQQPSQQSLTTYIDSHNAYVQQLHTTNAMLEAYHCETIPQLMQELQDVYADLCAILSDAIFNGADIISSKVNFPAPKIRAFALN